MSNIRPVLELRNKFTGTENMSIEQYSALTDDVEFKLDEADRAADSTDVRYSTDEEFKRIRGRK